MKKDNEKKPEDIKTDLKHDTMEFSASTDGEDPLDIDDTSYEEEEISAEELDILEDEEVDEAAAYVNAENELLIDEDTLPEEDWTEDLKDPADDEEEEEERRL